MAGFEGKWLPETPQTVGPGIYMPPNIAQALAAGTFTEAAFSSSFAPNTGLSMAPPHPSWEVPGVGTYDVDMLKRPFDKAGQRSSNTDAWDHGEVRNADPASWRFSEAIPEEVRHGRADLVPMGPTDYYVDPHEMLAALRAARRGADGTRALPPPQEHAVFKSTTARMPLEWHAHDDPMLQAELDFLNRERVSTPPEVAYHPTSGFATAAPRAPLGPHHRQLEEHKDDPAPGTYEVAGSMLDKRGPGGGAIVIGDTRSNTYAFKNTSRDDVGVFELIRKAAREVPDPGNYGSATLHSAAAMPALEAKYLGTRPGVMGSKTHRSAYVELSVGDPLTRPAMGPGTYDTEPIHKARETTGARNNMQRTALYPGPSERDMDVARITGVAPKDTAAGAYMDISARVARLGAVMGGQASMLTPQAPGVPGPQRRPGSTGAANAAVRGSESSGTRTGGTGHRGPSPRSRRIHDKTGPSYVHSDARALEAARRTARQGVTDASPAEWLGDEDAVLAFVVEEDDGGDASAAPRLRSRGSAAAAGGKRGRHGGGGASGDGDNLKEDEPREPYIATAAKRRAQVLTKQMRDAEALDALQVAHEDPPPERVPRKPIERVVAITRAPPTVPLATALEAVPLQQTFRDLVPGTRPMPPPKPARVRQAISEDGGGITFLGRSRRTQAVQVAASSSAAAANATAHGTDSNGNPAAEHYTRWHRGDPGRGDNSAPPPPLHSGPAGQSSDAALRAADAAGGSGGVGDSASTLPGGHGVSWEDQARRLSGSFVDDSSEAYAEYAYKRKGPRSSMFASKVKRIDLPFETAEPLVMENPGPGAYERYPETTGIGSSALEWESNTVEFASEIPRTLPFEGAHAHEDKDFWYEESSSDDDDGGGGASPREVTRREMQRMGQTDLSTYDKYAARRRKWRQRMRDRGDREVRRAPDEWPAPATNAHSAAIPSKSKYNWTGAGALGGPRAVARDVTLSPRSGRTLAVTAHYNVFGRTGDRKAAVAAANAAPAVGDVTSLYPRGAGGRRYSSDMAAAEAVTELDAAVASMFGSVGGSLSPREETPSTQSLLPFERAGALDPSGGGPPMQTSGYGAGVTNLKLVSGAGTDSGGTASDPPLGQPLRKMFRRV